MTNHGKLYKHSISQEVTTATRDIQYNHINMYTLQSQNVKMINSICLV